jgi:hypothetical protein
MKLARKVPHDIRFPSAPVSELQRHTACVNAIAWAPHSASHICSAGDHAQVMLMFHVLLLGSLQLVTGFIFIFIFDTNESEPSLQGSKVQPTPSQLGPRGTDQKKEGDGIFIF